MMADRIAALEPQERRGEGELKRGPAGKLFTVGSVRKPWKRCLGVLQV